MLLTRLAAVAALALTTASPVLAQNTGTKQVISTPNAPEAIGPYSQAIRAGNLVFLAGQIAIDPKTKQLMKDASIEDQTRRLCVLLQERPARPCHCGSRPSTA